MKHPQVEIDSYTLLEGSDLNRVASSPDAIDSDDEIIGLTAKAPVGLLKLKNPRQSTSQTDIVAHWY